VTSGARGEQLASDWLRRQRKFVIVARNWRNPRDAREEIDLVARDAGVLVFIEVKARAADALVPGYYAVNRRKRRILRRAIRAYLAGLRERPPTVRLDIVEVLLPAPGTGPGPAILHFENVALFSKHFRP
jgi:putative endonuclease